MDRRLFLKSSGAAAVAAALPWREALAEEGWRAYEIVSRVEILEPSGVSRAWVPLPMTDDMPWHKTVGNAWSGNAAQARIVSDGKYGVGMLYAEWSAGRPAPTIEVTSRCMTRERTADLLRPDAAVGRLSAGEHAFYTAATDLIPTDGIVRKKIGREHV